MDAIRAARHFERPTRRAAPIRCTKDGKVYRKIHGRWKELSPFPDRNDYRILKLRHHGTRRGYTVGVIVWRFFKGDIPHKHDIDHRDKRRHRNELRNLRPLPEAVNRGKRELTDDELNALPVMDFFGTLAEQVRASSY